MAELSPEAAAVVEAARAVMKNVYVDDPANRAKKPPLGLDAVAPSPYTRLAEALEAFDAQNDEMPRRPL